MKEHEIKLKVTEEELNEILDARMSNDDMANAILCYSKGSLRQFLKDNGFANNFVEKLSDVLLENIKEEFSFRKDYGQVNIDNLIDFEELIAFYLALSPKKNVKKLSENIGNSSIIKALKINNKKNN